MRKTQRLIPISKESYQAKFVGLMLLLLLTPFAFAAQDADDKKISKLKSDIGQLEKQLQTFQKEQGDVSAQLRKIEQQGAALHRQLQQTNSRIDDHKQRLLNLAGEQSRLEQEKQGQQSVLAEQLASAYRMGRQDQLKVLLNQQDPQRLSRIMNYYEYLNQSRVESIRQFQQTLEELSQIETEIQTTQSSLVEQQQSLQNKSQQLADSRRQRQKLLDALQQKIANTDDRLKADKARLQRLVTQLKQTLDNNDLSWESKEFRQLKGKLSWPTAGKISSHFGSSQEGIASEGIMIAAPAGREVRAVHNGRVVFSDWLRGYGLLIIIDHGSGYMSLYGHNQALHKTVGDWVSAKETIATVGDTGGNRYSGLYFAIRYKGQPYNPRPWLSKASG